MKVGIYTSPVSKLLTRDIEEVFKFVTNIGYKCVELSGKYHYPSQKKMRNSTDEVKSLLDKYGLEATAISYHVNHFNLNPKIRAEIHQNFKYLIEAASMLDIPTVITVSGWPMRFGDMYFDFCPIPEEYEKAWKEFGDVFGDYVDFAKRNNVKIAVEPHFPNLVRDTQTIKKMFEVIPSRTLGLNYDPSHMGYLSIEPSVIVKKFGERIYHMHAKDTEVFWDKRKEYGFLATRDMKAFEFRIPGYGDMNWGRLIVALSEVGYDGVLSYEHEDPSVGIKEGAEQAYKFLKAITSTTSTRV